MTPLEIRMDAAWHLNRAGVGDPLDNFAAALWPTSAWPDLDIAEIPKLETCRNGHIRTAENTLYRPNGWRDCRDCRRGWRAETKRADKPLPSHCKNGHEYTPDNIYYTPRGCFRCKTCRREQVAKCRARKVAA